MNRRNLQLSLSLGPLFSFVFTCTLYNFYNFYFYNFLPNYINFIVYLLIFIFT